MNAERWQRVEVLFDQAMDCPDAERKARMTELHYFGGLTQDEIAAVCEVHVNTVARDLRLAAAWLRGRMRDPA